jgi:UDP-3-O-[3-hydroxymyristoyl] glucosamine N-acyltransferase
MKFTAKQISEMLKGAVEGDPEITVDRLAKIEEAESGSLSFLANPKYTPYIYETGASIVIVSEDFAPEQPVSSTLIRVKDAYKSFAKLLEVYDKIKSYKAGVHSTSHLSESSVFGKDLYAGAFVYVGEHCSIGDNVKIYPNTYIGDNVTIGDNTTIFAGVNIYSDSKIGSDCTIHSGVVIGADGFGFSPSSGQYEKVAQIGNVIIEDHVEIGASTTIDRATLGSTIIRKGVKLDNLIQVAHNVEIGENTVVAAQTGIAGSTKIGRNCMIGGQVGIVGHIRIADDTKIAAQSGVGSSVEQPGQILQGSPAFAISDYKRSYVAFRKLPELDKKLKELNDIMKSLDGTDPSN